MDYKAFSVFITYKILNILLADMFYHFILPGIDYDQAAFNEIAILNLDQLALISLSKHCNLP